ncbi:MAG TPA: hypothetical protein VL359_00880 [bacterium]|nr:hypothetical protein [bacterium]
MNAEQMTLFSGASKGAEAEFGQWAEAYGIQEVNIVFPGHPNARVRGLYELSDQETTRGDVSLAYVSRLLSRNYHQKGETFRRVLQALVHIVTNSQQVFVVGAIQEDLTVRGGTGWGAEFAKLNNKALFVFDQAQEAWFRWDSDRWVAVAAGRRVTIQASNFAGLGTRNLKESGRQAIEALFRDTMVQ